LLGWIGENNGIQIAGVLSDVQVDPFPACQKHVVQETSFLLVLHEPQKLLLN
jgi:hypothetical protein